MHVVDGTPVDPFWLVCSHEGGTVCCQNNCGAAYQMRPGPWSVDGWTAMLSHCVLCSSAPEWHSKQLLLFVWQTGAMSLILKHGCSSLGGRWSQVGINCSLCLICWIINYTHGFRLKELWSSGSFHLSFGFHNSRWVCGGAVLMIKPWNDSNWCCPGWHCTYQAFDCNVGVRWETYLSQCIYWEDII